MILEEPLAKSSPPMTLRQHTTEVINAVEGLTNALSVPLAEVVPSSFTTMLKTAAFFHDLGKSATGFQNVVQHSGDGPRPRWDFRHEALSTAILLATGIEAQGNPQLIGAVLTHHKSLDHKKLTFCTGRGISRTSFEGHGLKLWRDKIAELLLWWDWVRAYVAEAEEIRLIPSLLQALPDVPGDLPDLYASNEELEETLEVARGLTPTSLPWILSRGFLMGGDHLASSGLLNPLTELDSGKIKKPVGFQKKMQRIQGSALLEAPTGSGKTEAALHWALANRRGGERIFYVLPYQASINKMGQRLEGLFGKENVGILHHRAALQEFTRHFELEADNYDDAAQNAKQRIDGTRQFYRPVKIITPYQLLKLMFGCRYFEIGLTELLGGLVIFDEIHAYDPHVAALIEICIERLRLLHVRFLFMTATFPDFLKERLQSRLDMPSALTVGDDNKRDKRLMSTARHCLHLRPCFLEALTEAIVTDAIAGKKVLVVCNRVAQAQTLYQAIAQRIASVTLLHSRFISKDRTAKENMLVAFPNAVTARRRQIPKASVLISTQVVEVSLDLSFDTIYTEAAPVDALLQRFGRVNRMNQHGEPVPVFVATEFDEKSVGFIYTAERIVATLKHAPDGEDLLPSVESTWVQQTYAGGYTEKEKTKYDAASVAFLEVVNNLRPLYTGDEREFYDLFDNYNVVPVRFAHLYYKALEEKRFYEAVGYVASISQSTFQKMKPYTEKLPDSDVHIINRRYDDELGLLDETETDQSYQQKLFAYQCL